MAKRETPGATEISKTHSSQTEATDLVADVVVRNPTRDRRSPKRRLPYLCMRNGRLTLIVREGVMLPSLTPFS